MEENETYIQIKFSTLEGKGVYGALNKVIEELEKAIAKHPEFPKFGEGQASVVMEEVGEWADAAKSGVWDHAYTEAAHACAVLIRAMRAPIGDTKPSADERMAEAMTALGDCARDLNEESEDTVRLFNIMQAGTAVLQLDNTEEAL